MAGDEQKGEGPWTLFKVLTGQNTEVGSKKATIADNTEKGHFAFFSWNHKATSKLQKSKKVSLIYFQKSNISHMFSQHHFFLNYPLPPLVCSGAGGGIIPAGKRVASRTVEWTGVSGAIGN